MPVYCEPFYCEELYTGFGDDEPVENELTLTATQVGSSVFLEWEFAT
jgi:hypothetical protein